MTKRLVPFLVVSAMLVAASAFAAGEQEKTKRDLWSSPVWQTPYAEQLSEEARVAGLSRIWSEAKFGFVYFDRLPDLDWDALYLSYLPRVRAAASTTEYYKLLALFIAQLKDGHTSVTPPKEVQRQLFGEPGLRVADIEGHIVVTDVFDPSIGLRRGAELVAVDGVPVRKYAAENVTPYQSASTTQDLAQRTWRRLLWGAEGSSVAVTVLGADGANVQRMLRRLTADEEANVTPVRPPFEFRMLPGNIAYAALNEFGDDLAAEGFEARLDEIAKADALILDIRNNGGGNSGVGHRVLSYLTDKPFRTSKWSSRTYRPTERAWGREEEVASHEPGEVQPNGKRFFAKPVVVLEGAKTFSAAEDFLVAFDAMKRGTIAGEPSGGSTGQPLSFALPGGGSARVCTKHDVYPDGKEFVGVGIQPQLLVHPTLADFRAGRDTVLHAAIAALKPAPLPDGKRYSWRRLDTESYKGKQDDIFFLDPSLGWYVNGAGNIYKTTDGGRTWTLKLHKPGTYFRCIGFVDEKRGFAGNIGPDYFPGVTDATPLYETRDGGERWTAVTAIQGPMPKGLCAIDVERQPFINAGVLDFKVRIHAAGRVGGPVFFLTSNDRGDSWTSTDLSAVCGMILDVKFVDERTGFLSAATSTDVASSNALILRTADGGRTWTKVYQSARPFETTWKSSFPSRNTGYVTIQSYNPDKSVTQRYVAKTTDGGRTWRELPVANEFAFREFGIAFLDERTGWIGGSTNGVETRDGGRTWTPVAFGRAVNKIRLLKDGAGWTGYAIGVDVYKLERQP